MVLRSDQDLFRQRRTTAVGNYLHPRFGAGYRHFVTQLSIHSAIGKVLRNASLDERGFPSAAPVLDTSSHYNNSGGAVSDGTTKPKSGGKYGKDYECVNYGIELIEQISSATGLTADLSKNKSEVGYSKSKSNSSANNNVTDFLFNSPPEENWEAAASVTTPQSTVLGSANTMGGMVLDTLLYHAALKRPLPHDITLSQMFGKLQELATEGKSSSILEFWITVQSRSNESAQFRELEQQQEEFTLSAQTGVSTPLDHFAAVGGLAILAELLPLLYIGISRLSGEVRGLTARIGTGGVSGAGAGSAAMDPLLYDMAFMPSEEEFDLFETIEGSSGAGTGGFSTVPILPTSFNSGGMASSKRVTNASTGRSDMPLLPAHSLVAFGLFLRLSGYPKLLLRMRSEAHCLLRLMLGITEDADGVNFLGQAKAVGLPLLPFTVLKRLYYQHPLATDDAAVLRLKTLQLGIFDLCLACLSVLSHHAPRDAPRTAVSSQHGLVTAAVEALQQQLSGNNSSLLSGNSGSGVAAASIGGVSLANDEKRSYWAKGTGFGTGSTTSSWDAEQALVRQRLEEEHCSAIIQVLAAHDPPRRRMSND